MRLAPCILTLLIAAGCAPDRGASIQSGSAAIGQWRPFYSRDFPQEGRRLDYFYDRSRLYKGGGHVVARWKVVSSRGEATTLYVIDISCREGTFTERQTVILGADGRTKELSDLERYAERPIETGTSGDVFRRAYCG
jgi:hypothetical protein